MLLSFLFEQIEKTEYRRARPDRDVTHITSNSRLVTEGSVFVCIKGFTVDGHNFAAQAYELGCRAFVASAPLSLPDDADVLITPDTRRALALLSCRLYGEPSKSMHVIGITGTKGKTTTALIIKQLLDMSGIPTGYIGSNGILFKSCKIETQNTTPESNIIQYHLKEMKDRGVEAVVIEVSSQALYLDRVLGIDFDVEIFTNLSLDHVGKNEHASFEEYMLAKKKLFDLYPANLVIANADDPHTPAVLKDSSSKKLFFSIDNASDLRASDIELYRDENILGVSFCASTGEDKIKYTIPIPGEFNVHNALAAISVARYFGIDEQSIADSLSKISISGRFETIVKKGGACFVIDYAHNGVSLASALKALRAYEPTRLICLFGSVGGRTQIRRAQLGKAASEFADFSILTSDNPDTENPIDIINDIALHFSDPDSFVSIPDRREAIEYAVDMACSGDIVLLAGKGHEKYQTVNGNKLYFCEREIIEDCINKIKLFG